MPSPKMNRNRGRAASVSASANVSASVNICQVCVRVCVRVCLCLRFPAHIRSDVLQKEICEDKNCQLPAWLSTQRTPVSVCQ